MNSSDMYCIVEVSVKNERKRCVLLAAYRREVEVPIQKKGLFRNRTIIRRAGRKKYLVFVPHQHEIKEIIEIDENRLLSAEWNPPDDFIKKAAFISKYEIEAPYCWEYKIHEYFGYAFIAQDAYFIGNVVNDSGDACLEALYAYDKALAALRIDA